MFLRKYLNVKLLVLKVSAFQILIRISGQILKPYYASNGNIDIVITYKSNKNLNYAVIIK